MKAIFTYSHLRNRMMGILLSSSLISYPTSIQATPLATSLQALRHSPSPYECAVLSAHVYQEDLKEGEQVIVYESEDNASHVLKDWKVSEILQLQRNKKGEKLDGYKGVIYVNSKKKQVVLAHRGTVLNQGALKTDILAIAKNIIKGQERHLPKILEKALATVTEQNNYSLTVTGHSLGGWLAQLTAFIARDNKKYQSKFHVKAVTFDTPGARPMLEQMNPKHDRIDIDQLDITNYLSSPNLINACNPHVGTLYRVVFDSFSDKALQYTLASHTISNFINAFDPTTGTERQCVWVRSWPLASPKIFKKTQKGLEKILDGQLIGAAGNFLEVLRMVNDGESLGQLSGFFKFAKKTNQYHPDGRNLFELKFKYHYHTEPFSPTRLTSRHLPSPVYHLLYHLDRDAPELDSVDQERELHGLDWDVREGILGTFLKEDIRTRVDRLLTIALYYPNLCIKEVPGSTNTPSQWSQVVQYLMMAPPSVSPFIGREELLSQLKSVYRDKNKHTIQLLTGANGLGKTQLALNLCHDIQKAYTHTFWISAESKESLARAYLDIAEKLGIRTANRPIEKTIQDVRLQLADQKCFYVFADAPDGKAIENFLPLQQGHVLITSRNDTTNSWPQAIKKVRIPPFSKQEIMALAAKFECALDCKDAATLDYLLRNMSGLPMALVQFFSFCQIQGHSPSDFVKVLKEQLLLAQDEEFLRLLEEHPAGNIQYDKSMLQSLRKILEQVRQEKHGAVAIEVLSRLAYLAPKGIPVNWLLATFFPKDGSMLKQETKKALTLLEGQSLIQWDRKRAHLYMQEVTQTVVRHLYPQSSLQSLVNHLIAYTKEKHSATHHISSISLLPHGRLLFERLDKKKYPQEAYELARCLAGEAYHTGLFLQEALKWSKKGLLIARQRYSQ